MIGYVDDSGRALVSLRVQSEHSISEVELQVWIDTGFTGDLVLPQSVVNSMNLRASSSIEAVLADGSRATLLVYSCLMNWFDELRELEVLGNDGASPLLGVGLLRSRRLLIDYNANTIQLD